VRDGSKGPLLVVIRDRDRDNQQVVQVDYYLSNAVPETPLWKFARVANAGHRIEECLQRSKSEAGLADYEGRKWTGWQHHQTLLLLATWFLVRETDRGKKWPPAIPFPQIRQGIAMILREAFPCGTMAHMLKECQKRLQRNELARFYHWKQRNRLAPLNLYKRQF
jgi:hypothetical protein